MKRLILLLLTLLLLTSCVKSSEISQSEGDCFTFGFAKTTLDYGEMSDYYIAGYRNGGHPDGILDPQQIRAAWIECGETSTLLIAVDCVGLDGGTIARIRENLADFTHEVDCDSVNVVSTHTHAGVDTLGLWGPIAVNGKNDEFVDQIIDKSRAVAIKAHANRTSGELFYSATLTENLQHDSREPIVFDENLHQFRFVPSDATRNSLRIVTFAAHAESLRGDNRMISADFVGELDNIVKSTTGDDLIFLPGAIGGLIMTPLIDGEDLVNNMRLTAARLAEYVLRPTDERKLAPKLAISRVEFETELENTLFMYYKFLGILTSDVVRRPLGSYTLTSEVTILQLGDIVLALLPGEVFPELVSGTGNAEDGESMIQIANRYGIENLVPVGLANDEIGYIIPSSDFVLSDIAPYVVEVDDHYEETNSVGRYCANDLLIAFDTALDRLP